MGRTNGGGVEGRRGGVVVGEGGVVVKEGDVVVEEGGVVGRINGGVMGRRANPGTILVEKDAAFLLSFLSWRE